MMKQKGKYITIDDLMVVNNTWNLIQQIKKTIESKFEMACLKEILFCIGIQIIRNKIEG
jgi:hypothetical protein